MRVKMPKMNHRLSHKKNKLMRRGGSTRKRRGHERHLRRAASAGSTRASRTSLAKSCVRNLSPSRSNSGWTAFPHLASTICPSFCLAPAASSKFTRKEFSPSLTNSRWPCAGWTATGTPEHHASITTLPSVSKLLAETRTSHAAYAVRSSSACSIFRSGKIFSLRDSSIKSAYSEVLSPTITKAHPSGMQCIRRWILFSEDHRLADKKIAFGRKPNIAIHLSRSAPASSANSSTGLRKTGDQRMGGQIAGALTP
mmetsp:Transcript_50099/g.119219  ORF Transcript_50099/g.119219 Transcript_50099/m.119219 type:complete len:254 (+) Transcript_50099:228-989(+)